MTVVGIAVKVAVYNRHWSTGGGGEKFAAGIAAALAAEHDVMLIAHEAVDTGWLGERLQLDLAGVGVDVVAEDAGAVSHAPAGYDLLVNASYRSGDPNRARSGLYVVHFPRCRVRCVRRRWRSGRRVCSTAAPRSRTATASTCRNEPGCGPSSGLRATPR